MHDSRIYLHAIDQTQCKKQLQCIIITHNSSELQFSCVSYNAKTRD